MTRTDIINFLVSRNKYKKYLEIGVRNKNDNFNLIDIEYKLGVDPDPNAKADFIMSSDDFFKNNKEMFDIIFIDGLHLKHQIIKDIYNSLNCLNESGTIVCHDCLPNSEKEQVDVYDGISAWTGTVWKGIAHLRMNEENIVIKTVNTDYGCGIIKKGKQKLFPSYEEDLINYDFYLKNKNDLLNVISVRDFLNTF